MSSQKSPEVRHIVQRVSPTPVVEGAGVRLNRIFPTNQLDFPDPFLLLDHFGSDNPADYLAGFPMHPHRGIETVTYMLAGAVRHKDSIGNSGMIEAGDVQWMTAGRGILHEEMPESRLGHMEGFQLWVNLPAALKMTPPRYQEISADEIPVVQRDGAEVRVIAGAFHGHSGPVTDIAADPTYLDVSLAAGTAFEEAVPRGHTAIAYAFRGGGAFGGDALDATNLAILGDGDIVTARAGAGGLRFLLISGQPRHEPIVRYGPFVMNTRAEILQTLADLQDGTFIR